MQGKQRLVGPIALDMLSGGYAGLKRQAVDLLHQLCDRTHASPATLSPSAQSRHRNQSQIVGSLAIVSRMARFRRGGLRKTIRVIACGLKFSLMAVRLYEYSAEGERIERLDSLNLARGNRVAGTSRVT